MTDPRPAEMSPPRYTRRSLPPYRYIPGETPHPRRHSAGHSRGLPEPGAAPLPPGEWLRDESYLHAVDLYNQGYWWECHEIFEALWRGAGPRSRAGDPAPGGPARSAGRLRQCTGRQDPDKGEFFQGLLQVAAAGLKRATGKPDASRALARRGLARLDHFEGVHRGLDVTDFARATRAWVAGEHERPPFIRLRLPGRRTD